MLLGKAPIDNDGAWDLCLGLRHAMRKLNDVREDPFPLVAVVIRKAQHSSILQKPRVLMPPVLAPLGPPDNLHPASKRVLPAIPRAQSRHPRYKQLPRHRGEAVVGKRLCDVGEGPVSVPVAHQRGAKVSADGFERLEPFLVEPWIVFVEVFAPCLSDIESELSVLIPCIAKLPLRLGVQGVEGEEARAVRQLLGAGSAHVMRDGEHQGEAHALLLNPHRQHEAKEGPRPRPS
mmetsp:Transcript_16808/g.33144  ORF Transcript_16808/g.33144 Transcript_16808/m.33144 type:complete len:233 (+) Transcript_16808:175-873(+)